jgi:hypothetical protein
MCTVRSKVQNTTDTGLLLFANDGKKSGLFDFQRFFCLKPIGGPGFSSGYYFFLFKYFLEKLEK